jgi:hypothetical protein
MKSDRRLFMCCLFSPDYAANYKGSGELRGYAIDFSLIPLRPLDFQDGIFSRWQREKGESIHGGLPSTSTLFATPIIVGLLTGCPDDATLLVRLTVPGKEQKP